MDRTVRQRLADGAASVVGGVASDLHATLMDVAFGNGRAVQSPHFAQEAGSQVEAGLSDLVGGTLEAVQAQLRSGGLDEMRAQLTGATQEQTQEQERVQERARE